MSTVLLFAGLLAGVVVLTPLADRWRIPLPVVLTLFGLLVPLLPGVRPIQIEPDLILPVVLPPLLFAATQRATARDFRENARPIALLAVGLTLATAAAVAVVAHAMGVPWGAAVVLGAIVAPPDPVAATAVARRLRLPGRLVTVLEGEGMFNDATALVLYKVSVATVVAGGLSAGGLTRSLVLAVGVGAGLGLAAGVLARAALARLHLAAPETTVTLAVPFVAYLLADRLGGSGVLAVLALGLYLRTYGHGAITSGGWLLGRAVWRYADYIVTSMVFVFIGFELTAVLETEPLEPGAVALALAVCGVLVAVRFGWLFPAVWLAQLRRHRTSQVGPVGGRETVITAWAGMRGVVTVATALALPAVTSAGVAFPLRRTVVFVGLVSVLATLVVQGLTLAPLVRRLGVGSDVDVAQEARALRRRATAAALDALRDHLTDGVPEPVRVAVTLQYEGYLAAQDALGAARSGAVDDDSGESDDRAVDDLLRQASEVEREVVIEARRRGEVSAEAADEVLDDVESRSVRDTG
ncbi:MAG TPA: Na+/H+ antiporter [Cellulomonas sp.]|uniref:Na+/H+ antiporter n=1 Tax=Cellulomonas sp. TaxID=40001 RepID=UPI002E31FB44|nr:Na+/H+ antiporter [Cellulomonas sp.]HEX5334035.1 Na+/H+ antiporter [Cellulomonas sp.]